MVEPIGTYSVVVAPAAIVDRPLGWRLRSWRWQAGFSRRQD